MRFGTLEIDEEPVANYLGEENTGEGRLARVGSGRGLPRVDERPRNGGELQVVLLTVPSKRLQ